MPAPVLASALDLVRWADQYEAAALLPALIRRLILATVHPAPTTLAMRANEGVRLAGWDGHVVCARGNAFVPSGESGWEMGVSTDITDKATKDYSKRTRTPTPISSATSTFVFVTPRRWAGKDSWIAKRKKAGAWQDIRVLDGDDLAAWLVTAPGVHLWLSERLGMPATEAQTVEMWWEAWRTLTSHPISPALMGSGREAAAQSLVDALSGSPRLVTVRADSAEEAQAFVAATMASHVDEAQRIRTLVVTTPSAWQHLASHHEPLILIPQGFRNALLWGPAIQKGHHVVLPVGNDDHSSIVVDVNRTAVFEAEGVLKAEGLSSAEAKYAAGTLRRSLAAYRRLFAVGDAPRPEWATAEHAAKLGMLALLGAWNENFEKDKAAVSQLTGLAYNEVSTYLLSLSEAHDAPFRQTGAVWRVNEKEDVWRLVARAVSAERVHAFLDLATRVLEAAPLPPSEDETRILTFGSSSPTYPHSGMLRAGVADSLAMLSALGGHTSQHDVPSYGGRARYHVKELLARAMHTSSVWIDLSSHLPDLAEAAPDEFLSLLEHDLSAETPSLLALYEEQPGFLSPNYEYPHLLWALERLAWSPAHFTRVALVTARLAARAPSTRITNSAFGSLKTFYRLWLPQCGGDFETRWIALDRMRKAVPDIAWRLMVSLVPNGHDSASIIGGPGARAHRWREWPTEAKPVTYPEHWQAVEALSVRLMEDVAKTPERWTDLAERIPYLHPSVHDAAFGSLASASETLDDTVRLSLWNELRDLVARHRSFPDAQWSWPEADLSRYDSVIESLTPANPADRHRWRFTQSFDYYVSENRDALVEVLDSHGIENLEAFAKTVESPELIGEALAHMALSEQDVAWVLGGFAASSSCQRLAHGYVWEASRKDQAWASIHLPNDVLATWPAEAQGVALHALQLDAALLNKVNFLSEDAQRAYWQRVHHIPRDSAKTTERAIEALLTYERPRFALNSVWSTVKSQKQELPARLVMKVLNEALRVPLEVEPQRPSEYKVRDLLEWLGKQEDVKEEDIALLEWHYLPLIHFNCVPAALSNQIVTDPSLFVEMVGLSFKRDDDSEGEHTHQQWERAFHALRSVRLPGMAADGGFDPTVFQTWTGQVWPLLQEAKLEKGGLLALGEMLVRGPSPESNVWPHPVLSDWVEEVASDMLDSEIRTAMFNSRGTTSRGPFDGGSLERSEAAKYDAFAQAMASRWPRVAAIHRRLRDGYLEDARRQDISATLDEDRYGE